MGVAHGDAPVADSALQLMAIHRGPPRRLAHFLDEDPELVHQTVTLDYGVHLSLFEVTLLHVAVEYNERTV